MKYGVFSQKATPLRALLLLALFGIPLFFWFRYLYQQFVVAPDQMSPEMRRMAEGMRRANEAKAAQAKPVPAAKKGDTQSKR